MHNRRSGFSLVELLIVMGIIILLVTMAIPSVRVLTGTRSISVAQNQLAAVITRAREDAIALQDIRGVLFYIDPISGRVAAVIVQQAVLTDTSNIQFNTVLLDTLPGNDSLVFPPGVGLQTTTNAMDPTGTAYWNMPNASHAWHINAATRAQQSATQAIDRYTGLSPINGMTYHGTLPFNVGGCILFDGNGRLIVRPYGFQMSAYVDNTTSPNSQLYPTGPVDPVTGKPLGIGIRPSNLCTLMGFDQTATSGPPSVTNPWRMPNSLPNPTYFNSNNFSAVFMPGCPNNFTNQFPKVPMVSQVGLILFDHDSFQSLGFTDADSDVQGIGYSTPWPINGISGVGGDGIHSEMDEENWLDVNSTPITINRVNGTLIRGE